jgi:YD repeat-containing protein
MAERVWTFCSDANSSDCGLMTGFEERAANGRKALRQTAYAWSRTTDGVPYLGTAASVLDPGTADEKHARAEFARDAFGNLAEQRQYDYDNTSTPIRTQRFGYLTDPAYLSKHVCNRLVSSTVSSDGQMTTELVHNQYDTLPLISRTGLREHDTANCGVTNSIRGNVTESVRGGVYRRVRYDMTGVQAGIEDSSGYRASFTPADNTNNAAIGFVIPNGNANLGAQAVLDAALRPTTVVKPNGATQYLSYDNLGRLATATSADGATAAYAYSVRPTAVSGNLNGRWTKVELDGCGRPSRIQKGDGTGAKSIVDYEYDAAPNAPMGRLKRVSLPHSPDQPQQWVNYTWDELGRLASRDLPGSGGTKTFSYSGNSVTVTDPAGRRKTLVYSATGRLAKVVIPNGKRADLETHYTYDPTGNLTGVLMPRAEGTQQRTFAYDAGGRVLNKRHAERGPETRTYNPDGTLACRTDAKGQRTVCGYDLYKRLISVQRFASDGTLRPAESVR